MKCKCDKYVTQQKNNKKKDSCVINDIKKSLTTIVINTKKWCYIVVDNLLKYSRCNYNGKETIWYYTIMVITIIVYRQQLYISNYMGTRHLLIYTYVLKSSPLVNHDEH